MEQPKKRRASRIKEGFSVGSGSPGSDILGKLSAIIRGHGNYVQLNDDIFDDFSHAPSLSPMTSSMFLCDAESPCSVRLSHEDRSSMRQSNTSPRPLHDTILVTEFRFLHTSFAPPFPLAASETPLASPRRLSESTTDTEEITIDPDNLRDSVRLLVRQIQEDTRSTTSSFSNPNDLMDIPFLQHTDMVSDGSVCTDTEILQENTSNNADERSDVVLTTSVRNLVLNLRRDCARQSLNPASVIGMPTKPTRRRGSTHPPSSMDEETAALFASLPPLAQSVTMASTTSQKHDFSRIMNSVAGSLRRLSIHKMKPKPQTSNQTCPSAPDIDGARWKIVELAFRFGGTHRYYLVQAVNMFSPLTKYGRRGGPHATRLVCHPYGTLQWEHKRGGFSAPVDLALASAVVDGRETTVFAKFDTTYRSRQCSLSVIFGHRTLDLEAQSADHRDWLGSALRTLMQYAKKQRYAETLVMEEEANEMMAPVIA